MFGVTLTGANILFITQHLQFVEGLPPLRAGEAMLPAVAASIVGFLVSPWLARRIRPAYLIAAGLAVSIGGAMLLTHVDSGDLMTLIAAYAIWNLGCAPLISLSMDLVVGSAPVERAGSAAALGETNSEFAFALGIAVLGSLGTAVYRIQVADTPAAGFGDSLPGAVAAAPLNEAVILAAQTAFTDSMHVVAASSGLVLLAVAVLTLTGLGHLPRIGSKHAEGHASAPPLRSAIPADVVPA